MSCADRNIDGPSIFGRSYKLTLRAKRKKAPYGAFSYHTMLLGMLALNFFYLPCYYSLLGN